MRFVYIMIDTLRADYLGCYGCEQGLTPELDALAKESFVFDRAYISSFPTVPNREDIFTGKYGFPHHGWGPLPSDAVTMAEIFTERGYLTQLITDTPHLIGRHYGYQRGFQAYHWVRGHENDVYLTRYNQPFEQMMPYDKTRMDELYFPNIPHPKLDGHPLVDFHFWINRDRLASEQKYFVATTAQDTSQWIEDNYKCSDFVLWVDTFECHEPFAPPEYYVERFDPGYDGDPMYYPDDGPSDKYTKAELGNMRARFAGEVALTSKWVGHVIRKLQDVGIYDDTMLVVTSDHGTYLGEHGRTGKFLLNEQQEITPWPQYDEVHRVPLLIKMPGQTRGKRVKQVVQPVDFLPTMVDLAKAKTDLAFEGHTMRPLLEGRPGEWPRKYAYGGFSLRDYEPTFWTMVTGRGWCLNVGGSAGDKPELFHLKTDPGQTKNVYRQNKKVAETMGRAYLRFLESAKTDPAKIALMSAKFA